MAFYSVGVRTAATTINECSAQLLASASKPVRLVEVSVSRVTGAAVQTLGLARPTAIGTGSSGIAPLPLTPGFTAGATAFVTWSAQPTVAAPYIRRWHSAASIGASIVWRFEDGLYIPANTSIVTFNVTASEAMDINFTFEE